MKDPKIRTIGRLRYQFAYEATGWYYISRKGEQIKIKFFLGTIEEYEGSSLRQFIVGPFALSWSWTD